MYNVKILKYPAGWQVRVYSRPVGYRYEAEETYTEYAVARCWDDDAQDYITEFYNPKKQCLNPFTESLCTFVEEPKERDLERSIKNSMSRTINRVYHLSRSNIWEWFITLTFNPDKVNSFDYDECVLKLKRWIDTVRRTSPDMKYIIIPEKHKSGRYHFHGLIANCEGLVFEESGYFTKDKQPIYNIGKYRLGWSTATKIMDNERATKYICKYITKELCAVAFGKKRYWTSRNLDECEVEELIVEGDVLPGYIDGLDMNCKHKKIVGGSELTTIYYEFGKEE